MTPARLRFAAIILAAAVPLLVVGVVLFALALVIGVAVAPLMLLADGAAWLLRTLNQHGVFVGRGCILWHGLELAAGAWRVHPSADARLLIRASFAQAWHAVARTKRAEIRYRSAMVRYLEDRLTREGLTPERVIEIENHLHINRNLLAKLAPVTP